MYVRPPSDTRGRVSIPENYSGHAFRDPSSYSDMPPATRVTPLSNVKNDYTDISTEEISATISPSHFSDSVSNTDSSNAPADKGLSASSDNGNSENNCTTSPSPFSSLLPKLSGASKHFPFGHGIGSEEILILAIMLIVYLSGAGDGKGDDELLLLLGLLLFAG